MKHHTGHFTGFDGSSLFEQHWQPENSRATLIIVHGLAEYSSRYEHVAAALAESNIATATFDLRGHGQSAGKRAFVNRFDDYLRDLAIFVDRVSAKNPDKPLFLLGHSMGGAIALLHALDHQNQFSGLILSSAALKIHDDFSPLLQRLSGVIAAILPKLPTLKIDSKFISLDPAVVREYDSDPQIYHGGTIARTGAEIVKATHRIRENAHKLQLPLFIFHGTGDRITDPKGSKLVHDLASSPEKLLKLYDGLYHETMNEPEKDAVIANLVQWLNLRISRHS